jgi:hypothetical protein
MPKSVKDKVVAALMEATGSNATIRFDDRLDGMIGGLVLSDSFAGQPIAKRQRDIRKYLEAHLNVFERTRLVFIATETPEEHDALNKAAD